MTFPAADSLLYILRNSNDEKRIGLAKVSGALGGPGRYTFADKALNDLVLDLIFADSEKLKREAVLGQIDRQAFVKKFFSASMLFRSNEEALVQLFGAKSFAETYFHPKIAQELYKTKAMIDPERMGDRLKLTGKAVLEALKNKDCAFAYMFAIAESHRGRDSNLYNAETVQFVLLTFSYFGQKAAQITDGEWFYLWKVFGSMMGLPLATLPNNGKDAREKMHNLRTSSQLTTAQTALLDAFISVFLDSEDRIRDWCKDGAISKRMEQYLSDTGRWPSGLKRPKGWREPT